jgi:hypothetical protein
MTSAGPAAVTGVPFLVVPSSPLGLEHSGQLRAGPGGAAVLLAVAARQARDLGQMKTDSRMNKK